MIQPHELRLGNLIIYEGEVLTVNVIRNDYIEAGPLSINSVGLQAIEVRIPLTEEWLLKFGFEKLSNFEEQYMEEDYVWQIDVERSPSLLLSNGIFHEDNYGVKLEYVHQLQNLYFALTGKELELTPTI